MMTERHSSPLLLIADSHVEPLTAREDEFFAMLSWIETTSCDVFFLGDNIDLWIASGERYEKDAHRRFLDWCRREKARRRVLMVEGNHEFYLKRHHEDCFTECQETFYKENGILFLHGDVAQRKLGFHRCFRAFAKNAFGDWVMGWLPLGPAFARIMKCFLSSGNTPSREKLMKPMEFVKRRVVALCHEHDVARVVMGHFHLRFHEEPEGVVMDVIPAWKYNNEIGVLETDGSLSVHPWREVKTILERKE